MKQRSKIMGFDKSFLIGAATAAHQVEGNNIHSDYWTMEHMKSTSFVEPSADAVDHYNRYEEDIKLLVCAGLNCYRFSIEWARIEPVEGQFDEAEVEHYRKMIRFCKDNGVTPIVTLHHFTSPKWLISKGGWEAESTVGDFRRYCAYVAEKLGDELTYIVTINEANMGLQLAAIAKRYMKELLFGKKKKKSDGNDGKAQVGINLKQMLANQKIAATENVEVFGMDKLHTFVSQRTPEGDLLIMRAHTEARNAMKAICPHLKIGLSLSLHDMQPQRFGKKHAQKEWYAEFGHYLPYIKDDDFLGVQNYTRSRFGLFGQIDLPKGAELTQMSYEFYPEALANVIRTVYKEFKGDIIVTENGIATTDDSRRVEFIRRALAGVQGCIDDGIPVKGYCHWSLLDNFEWQKGFSMTFGLIAVDRKTQTRYPKESLAYLGNFRK
jgi:beta-glucosidase